MTIAWRALTGLALVLIVGCGGAAEPDPEDPEGAVKIMFEEYMDALAEQDWERACSHSAPELVALQQNALREAGASRLPTDCVGMWETTVETGLTDVPLTKDATEDARLDRVYVNKDTARVDYTRFMDSGTTTPITLDARPGQDGKWLIVRIEEPE